VDLDEFCQNRLSGNVNVAFGKPRFGETLKPQ